MKTTKRNHAISLEEQIADMIYDAVEPANESDILFIEIEIGKNEYVLADLEWELSLDTWYYPGTRFSPPEGGTKITDFNIISDDNAIYFECDGEDSENEGRVDLNKINELARDMIIGMTFD